MTTPGNDPAPLGAPSLTRQLNANINGSFESTEPNPCDSAFTPMTTGSDGGLSTVSLQPLNCVPTGVADDDCDTPSPNFNNVDPVINPLLGPRDCLVDRIIQPVGFFGVDFSAATGDPNGVDVQSGLPISPVVVTHDGSGNLSGDIRAWEMCWSASHLNQGGPKADGTTPGFTSAFASGTINPTTCFYTLEWFSLIVGGAFDGFSGGWHLEGTYTGTGIGCGGGPLPTLTATATPTITPTPTITSTPTATATPTPTPTPTSFLLGDVNCDGEVNSLDAFFVLAYEANFLDTLPCLAAADVNCDGAINSLDAFFILAYEANFLAELPGCP